MRYRVDELAAHGGVSVDTVRFYQAKGLLPAPQREGRIAWYSEAHLDTLKRIRELKDNGFTLATIKRLLSGDLDAVDHALVSALTEALPGASESGEPGDLLTLEELARVTGMSTTLLEAIRREGLLVPGIRDGEPVYTSADAAAVSAGVALLETGVPLSELLALAREHDRAMKGIAERAVELFLRFVRDPLRASGADETEVADRLVAAFHKMLPATSAIVAHHFERVLLSEALARIERDGVDSEIEAVREHSERRLQSTWPA